MKRASMALGPQETRLLSTLERCGISVLSVARHRGLLRDFSDTQLRDVVHGLSTKGCLTKIEGGKYLVVPRAGRGVWHEHPFVVASGIAPEEHYISYWSALSHHQLTEQVPRVVYVALCGKRKRPVEFQGWRYRFVCLAERKFFGFETEDFIALNGAATIAVAVASPEKAILDSLDDEMLAGGVPEVAKALWRGLEARTVAVDRLVEYAARLDDAAVVARLGYLLDRLGVAEARDLAPLVRRRGLAPLLSTKASAAGAFPDRRWHLRVNIAEAALLARAAS
ncbi:MAG: hypothetical protein HYY04_02720 [Chloroflexi bacterium]|nr:hypothetical protein [Chloroflexota bacterium]